MQNESGTEAGFLSEVTELTHATHHHVAFKNMSFEAGPYIYWDTQGQTLKTEFKWLL